MTENLVKRCQEGDASAWTALVRQFAPLVYVIARAYRLREDQCDDVAQSVFLALAKGLHTLHRPESLKAWIASVARREAARVRKASMRTAETPDVGRLGREEEPPLGALEKAERLYHLREAMQQLGDRCQRLLEALYLNTQTADYQAVAQRIGIPVGSIGPTRLRCLARLAEIIRSTETAGGPEE